MANTDLELTTIIKVNPILTNDVDKIIIITTLINPVIIVDVKKDLSTITKSNPVISKEISKEISTTTKVNPNIKRNTGKIISTTIKVNPTMLKLISKKVATTTKVNPVFTKNIAKIITTIVKVSVNKQINNATLTLFYNGNVELGLGAEEGAKFDIIVTGTFTTFSISINGKTLTYTESCTAQTITIDNVNATCKNGSVNKMSKLTGDTAEFLKLLPGENIIVYSKVGGDVDFTFDFRPQFI